PATTIWSDNPALVLQGPWVTEPQKSAARAFVGYLSSRPVQELAITFGFRPADPNVPIKTSDPPNPFPRLADRGIKLDTPPLAAPPSGEVVRTLRQMWTRTVAK